MGGPETVGKIAERKRYEEPEVDQKGGQRRLGGGMRGVLEKETGGGNIKQGRGRGGKVKAASNKADKRITLEYEKWRASVLWWVHQHTWTLRERSER